MTPVRRSLTWCAVLFVINTSLSQANENISERPVVAETVAGEVLIGPRELEGVSVLYFPKDLDQNRVLYALQAAHISYSLAAPENTKPTNVLTCTPDVGPAAVKKLARLMLDVGVNLRAILPSVHSEFRNTITLEAYEGNIDWHPVLSREEIETFTSCPNLGRTWIAARDLGIEYILHVGDRLRADRNVDFRLSPAESSIIVGAWKKGSIIFVNDVVWDPAGHQWILYGADTLTGSSVPGQWSADQHQIASDPLVGPICAGPLGPGPCAAVRLYIQMQQQAAQVRVTQIGFQQGVGPICQGPLGPGPCDAVRLYIQMQQQASQLQLAHIGFQQGVGAICQGPLGPGPCAAI